MEEVVVFRYCDLHLLREGARLEANHSPTIGLDGAEARIDLCGDCDADALGALRSLFAAIGRRAHAPTGKTDDPGGKPSLKSQCAHPGCFSWMDVRSRQSHAKQVHGVEPGEIEWRYGPEVELVWVCSCKLTFPSHQGRSAHIRRFGEEHAAEYDAVPALRAA